MPVYNNPYFAANAGPDLERGFGSLASMFAPPSPQTIAAYSEAGLNTQKRAIIDKLSTDPRYKGADAGVLAGLFAPTNSWSAQDQNNATTRYQIDQNNAASMANNQNTVKGSVLSSMFAPEAPGDVRPEVPTNVASTIGLPTMPAVAGVPSLDTAKAAAFDRATPEQQTEVTMQGVSPVMARTADGQTTFQNPQQAVDASSAPAVVPGSPQQAFQAADAGNQATDYNGILNAGRQATSRLNVLNVLDEASKGAGYQGVGGTNVMAMRQALAAFGVDTSKEADAEVLSSGGSQLALQMRNPANGGGMPGSMSDGDRQFLSSMVAGLDHTPQGNQKLIAVAKAIAQRDVDTAAAASAYVNKNHVLDGGFTVQQSHFADTHPLLPGMPANPKDANDFASLPSGMQYLDPGDGLVHVKP